MSIKHIEKIKINMQRLNLDEKKLGKLINVSSEVVKKHLTGEKEISLKTLIKYSRVLKFKIIK